MKDPVQKLLIASAMLAGTMGVAHAAAPTFYAGADVARLTTKIDDQTGTPANFSGTADTVTLRLRGGAHFVPGLDAELHAVLPQSGTYSNTSRPNSLKTTVAGVFAKPNVDAGPVNIYGLIGYSYAFVDLSGVVKSQQSASGFAYGPASGMRLRGMSPARSTTCSTPGKRTSRCPASPAA